ncbi:MAG: nucleoside 2-deoxyribosyltransferase [Alphaproteobacteria bacterium]|nr:nucleoside 2-deoxyribosyltransferase [Alphaproteobacteria bacterium]
MKKVYLSGKFNKTAEPGAQLAHRLRNDYRAILLGDENKLVTAADNVKLNDKYSYSGPFYCEQASTGEFTSTECNVVVAAERMAVDKCDVFIAVFDEQCSPGTIVELGWALNAGKQIYILYKPQESKYTIKSEHWFPITDAQMRDKRAQTFAYMNTSEMLDIIKNKILI